MPAGASLQVSQEQFGEVKSVELCEGGSTKAVTHENKSVWTSWLFLLFAAAFSTVVVDYAYVAFVGHTHARTHAHTHTNGTQLHTHTHKQGIHSPEEKRKGRS